MMQNIYQVGLLEQQDVVYFKNSHQNDLDFNTNYSEKNNISNTNSSITIRKMNTYDIQGIDEFVFSNEKTELIFPNNYSHHVS